MNEYTKDNPGCYHSSIKYLSEITGISMHKEIYFDSVKDIVEKNKKGKTVLKYMRRNVFVEKDGKRYWMPVKRQRKGGIVEIEMNDGTTFPVGTIWDKIGVSILRPQNEFGIAIKPEGTYKDSLGGGWYSSCELYSINGRYFANMDCTCCI